MGLKWTANDSLAYRAVTDAGERLRKTYDEAQAGKAYKEGSEVTNPEDAKSIAAYQDTATGLRNVDPDGNDQYAHLSAEQRTAAADAYEKAGLVGRQYHVGRGDGQVGSGYQAAPSAQQRHMGGLEGQQRYFSERGNIQEAGRLGERIEGIKTGELSRKAAAQAIELGGVQLNNAKRQEELDAVIRAAGAADDKTFLATMADFASNKAGDKNEGFTFRRDAETGQFFIQQHDRKTRELLGEQPWDGDRGSLITRLTKYHNAASFNAAVKNEDENKQRGITNAREDRRTDIAEQNARTQERQAEAAVRHYGAQAAQWQRSHDLAKRDYDLKASQFGPDSPAAKSAKLAYEKEKDFDTRTTKLTEMMESGAHPKDIRKEQVALETKHPEKSKSKTKEYDTDGRVVGEKLVSSLDPAFMKYQKEYVAREQQKVATKYGSKANIQVLAQPDGSMQYRDSLTPEGQGYTSLDELVKARGLRPLYAEGRIGAGGLQR